MARRKKRTIEAFSLSFLDCICCGFGAIVLLLVLSKIYEPIILEKTNEDLKQLIAKLQEELFNIRGETDVMSRALGTVQLETSETKMRLSTLQRELNTIQGQYDLINTDDPLLNLDEGDLRSARQRLTEEMLNLAPFRRTPDDAIGGIPVDSEYVIFVIDTSGSMQAKWGWAEEKLAQVLNVYPRVKGLQIMNDNGRYMFEQYGGTWIEDTPQIRASIKQTMRQWAPFSDSDPTDGIQYASETFWAPDKKISIYVLGDEFQGGSMESVLRAIDRVNVEDENGDRRVRIHAIGFPYNFTGTPPTSSQRFAGLMRVLCERNGGTFVALTEVNR
jgi:ribosomal protein L29